MNIRQMVEQFKTFPGYAVRCGETSITYPELYQQIQALTLLLNPYKNCITAVFLPCGASYIISLLSAMNAENIAMPVSTDNKSNTITDLYNAASFSLLITDRVHYSLLPDTITENKNISILILDIMKFLHPSPPTPERSNTKGLRLLLSTSGTTSTSKIVMLSEENILYAAQKTIERLLIQTDSKLLIIIPLYCSFGNLMMFSALEKGTCICLLKDVFSLKNFFHIVEEKKITHLAISSSQLTLLCLHKPDKYNLNSLKTITFGGSYASENILDKLIEYYPNSAVCQGYGMTETSGLISVYDAALYHSSPNSFITKKNSVGLPISNTKVKLSSTDNEILFHGANIMLGYYKNEDATKEMLKDGWLHTGDIGEIDKDGYVYITGRKKNIIIVGGFNVYPEEVERKLLLHPDITDCLVYSSPDYYLGEKLQAMVTLRENSSCTELSLKRYYSSLMPSYQVPYEIKIVNKIPKKQTWKNR